MCEADLLELLEELLLARGPGGQEREVREIARRELQAHCDQLWQDPAGNLVGRIRAADQSSAGERHAVRLLAHLDEIAMVVKRVEADGTLRVEALGGAYPFNFGACPVELLGDQDTLPGVLSFGPMHATQETPQGSDLLQGRLQWSDVHVVTRLSAEELTAQGVHPGTRVVLARHWRKPFRVEDAIAAHFMDDRAPVLATLLAARQTTARRAELECDVYFVFTTMEEETNAGALYAARTLPGDVTVAVEVGPVAAEYGTQLSVNPIVNTGDRKGYYSKSVTDALLAAARRRGLDPQSALLVDFASDASAILQAGLTAKAGCIAIPTENTHGYETVVLGSLAACADTLVDFVLALRPADSQAQVFK
jgi:putative aminopeptidase FrvX